jgi:hypothetical protein
LRFAAYQDGGRAFLALSGQVAGCLDWSLLTVTIMLRADGISAELDADWRPA